MIGIMEELAAQKIKELGNRGRLPLRLGNLRQHRINHCRIGTHELPREGSLERSVQQTLDVKEA